mgnify:CR=1 FL=1
MKEQFAKWNYAQFATAVDYWWKQKQPMREPTEAQVEVMCEFWMSNHYHPPGADSWHSESAISYINHAKVFRDWAEWDNNPVTGVLRNPPCA